MSAKTKTPTWALDNVRFTSDAGSDLTCREYLCTLLQTVWDEKEGFSGKRPFGTSGWEHDIYGALADAECITSAENYREADLFVLRMIARMMDPTTPTRGSDE